MTDLVVVGGGIVGASSCYYANQIGARCTLIERDGIASHASGFAFGGLHPRVVATNESEMQRFAAESFEEHRRLHEELEYVYGVQSSWRRRSSISLAWNELDVHQFKAQRAKDSSTSEWLDAHDLNNLEPRISTAALGGLMTNESAEVDSAILTESLVSVASPEIFLDEVVDIELAQDRIDGVRIRRGEMIEGDAFVFAMGPWSDLVFNWFEMNCSVKPLKGQILRLHIEGPAFQHSFSTEGNYMSTKPDGLLWIGTTEEEAKFNEAPTDEGRRKIMGVLQRMVPGSRRVDVVKQTACFRPISPDGELILGCVPGINNAFVGTGGGRKGILYGPLMGKYLANIALATDSLERWSSFAPDRFSENT
ncbi:MAG: FAD-dependent oxidoreductase [Gammaproteobacteria bacterium]|nr:FAD-dependent oxidoreductase [Gammaproteobacteria bacterium]